MYVRLEIFTNWCLLKTVNNLHEDETMILSSSSLSN